MTPVPVTSCLSASAVGTNRTSESVALATATLSFGLFAAPAIAQVEVLDDPTVRVISNGVVVKEDARNGYQVRADIPVDAIEIDAANVLWATASAVRYNGTQKVTQTVVANSRNGAITYLDANGYDLGSSGGLVWDDVAFVRATFNVDPNMLDGVWTIDGVGISNDGAEEEITDLDANFTVQGNQQNLLPNIANNTVTAALTLTAPVTNSDGTLLVTPTVTGAQIEYYIATYTLPGGDTITRFGYDPAGATGSYTFQWLESGIIGKYELSNLTLIDTNHVVYDLEDQTAGDYTVNFGAGISGAFFDNAQTLFRLYNKWDGQHLYTGDPVERQTAIKNGWTDEGLAWYAPTNANLIDRPVYRLYNNWTGEYHYTTGEAERVKMIADGWTDENVGFYSAEMTLQTGQKQFGAKVFRLFNPFVQVGTHHYTLSSAEYELLKLADWKQEGVSFYGYKVFETDMPSVTFPLIL